MNLCLSTKLSQSSFLIFAAVFTDAAKADSESVEGNKSVGGNENVGCNESVGASGKNTKDPVPVGLTFLRHLDRTYKRQIRPR